MAKPKHITKEQCIVAMKQTRSVRAAARYLNCSYQHLKPFMKAYKDEETGLSLFELHKNQSGKGIPKFLIKDQAHFATKFPAMEEIVNGKVDASSFNPEKLKFKLVEAGYMIEQCYYCGFNEKRNVDGKIPLIMVFLNKHRYDFTNGNAQLCCYNCYFLQVGNVFTERDLDKLESHQTVYKTSEMVNFQVDEYTKKRLEELGGFDAKVDDDPYSLVSRKK
jgi:hypothetical protein